MVLASSPGHFFLPHGLGAYDLAEYCKLGNFSLYEIFVGKIFVLKNFRRVDVLRKYLNTKILQHRSREERTARVAAMEKFFERNYIRGYHVYKKSMGGDGWRGVGVPKNSSDRYAVAVKNEGTIIYRIFTSKAVAGVFAVFATGKYTVASVSVEREHVEWCGV